MVKFLKVQSKLEGQGEFVVQNTTPISSGANGLQVFGKVAVTNLTVGETLTITVDGKEVFNVNTNGVHPIRFTTKLRMYSEVVNVAYAVSGAGTADVVLDLDA
jgi:hypothetical protein